MTTWHAPDPRARSHWMQEAIALEPFKDVNALKGSVAADVCIVGGGYVGLWTAIRVREAAPEATVVVLESDVCASGASGLNGGLVMTWWSKYTPLRKAIGSDGAKFAAEASVTAISEIEQLLIGAGHPEEFSQQGWVWAATNQAQMNTWDSTLEEIARTSDHRPFEVLPVAEMQSLTGSQRHIGGVFESSVATVQPAVLGRVLRRRAIEAGVTVHERSPLVKLTQRGNLVHLLTPHGQVRAEKAVLATNAWTAQLPELRRRLLVLGSDMIATAPVPDFLEGTGLAKGVGISDSRRLVHYYRATRDGRIVFGKGGGRIGFGGRVNDNFSSVSSRLASIRDRLHWTYPELQDVPITSSWSGAVDYSVDGLPFFAQPDHMPNVYYGVGFSGNGVGPSAVAGRILASLVLEKSDDWTQFGLVRRPAPVLPIEPFRFVGGHLVRQALLEKERREDNGQQAPWAVQKVAALDPTSFIG